MAHKILLAGKNIQTMEKFFETSIEGYELMTSSIIYQDVEKHLNMYAFDVFLYCTSGEDENDFNKLLQLKTFLGEKSIKVVVVGNGEDTKTFQNKTGEMAAVVLDDSLPVDKLYAGIDVTEDSTTEPQEERRKHVLVIDDDPLMLKLIKEYLHDKYDVATAVNGKVAYKFLENKRTDMILLDYEMPMETGPQVLVNIRKTLGEATPPVLFLTGVTDVEKVKEVLSHKPQGYLLKPIEKDKLIANVEKFLG